uniref:CTD small phosphatase 2 n=1 Tax=Sus scrofa TaxID=9823 RepID=A0A8D1H4F7_PIG
MEHGSIITQARREDALVLTKQGLVSKSSPKKPRGRNIFKALFCCFGAQHVGQSSSSTELSAYKEEANTIAKVAGFRLVSCKDGTAMGKWGSLQPQQLGKSALA